MPRTARHRPARARRRPPSSACKAEVPAEARTADTLGRERSGTGVVIDAAGLVLTIGYLILEATAVDLYAADGKRIPAEIVGYDHDTGFGLVRATLPLDVHRCRSAAAARSPSASRLLVLSRDGQLGGREAKLASRREFAGYWEYLLPDALFTTPPHPDFAGAALIDRTRAGWSASARCWSATPPRRGRPSPGNMFVPIDALTPILGDLLALGRRDAPGHPWVGVSAQEHGGRLIVRSVADDGPAEAARRPPGDVRAGRRRHPGRRRWPSSTAACGSWASPGCRCRCGSCARTG